jgi:hypothetical protein
VKVAGKRFPRLEDYRVAVASGIQGFLQVFEAASSPVLHLIGHADAKGLGSCTMESYANQQHGANAYANPEPQPIECH